jgi:hypothetical protein
MRFRVAQRFASSAAALWFTAGCASQVLAGYPVTDIVNCPVGGKSFQYQTTGSFTTFFRRLDGKPTGSWTFPLALPVCPDNGLVVFDKFQDAELPQLSTLIASAEYMSMANSETAYFKAYWLAKRLRRASADVAWLLIQASWEADDDEPTKARYQALYVMELLAMPFGEDIFQGLQSRSLAINALRELGRFDEAKILMMELPWRSLAIIDPNASTVASGTNADAKRALHQRYQLLNSLLEHKNRSVSPVHALPLQSAIAECAARGNLLPIDERDYCGSIKTTKD